MLVLKAPRAGLSAGYFFFFGLGVVRRLRQLREDLVDDVEILAAAGGLLLQIDQIGRRVIEPAGEQRRELQRDLGLAAQELDRVVDDVGFDVDSALTVAE